MEAARGHASSALTGAADADAPDAEPEAKRRPLGCLIEVVETLVLTLVIFFVVQAFVAQPYRVQQDSMERTLEPDQYVLVDKLTPHFGSYNRGDIIVLNPPPGSQRGDATPFIKRVIGIGGDTVEIKGDGFVYVNGTRLAEPYLYAVDGTPQATTTSSGQSVWQVPTADLFVMGDHRAVSEDSRVFGLVKVDSVVGRAWLRYWPADSIGILQNPGHPELSTPAP